MDLDPLIKPFVKIAFTITKLKEKRLGYKIDFKKLPTSWLQSKVTYQMDDIWQKAGLDAIGTNYFTMGAIEDKLSTRFNPNSAYYQSWLGGYIVKFKKDKHWDIDDHFKLCLEDQKSWLKNRGDPNPYVRVDFSHIQNLGKVQISGYGGELYQGSIFSDTDVGDGKINFYQKCCIAGLAYYLNSEVDGLNLKCANFLPTWTDKQLSFP